MALCFYKLRKYKNAIRLLETYCFPDKDKSESKGSSLLNISSEINQLYLLSICYKGSLDFEKAEKTYGKFLSLIEDSSNREIALYLFALLNHHSSALGPRKVEEIKSGLIRSLKTIFPEDVDSVSRFWDPLKKAWVQTNIEGLLNYLSGTDFFKRFPKQILVFLTLTLD